MHRSNTTASLYRAVLLLGVILWLSTINVALASSSRASASSALSPTLIASASSSGKTDRPSPGGFDFPKANSGSSSQASGRIQPSSRSSSAQQGSGDAELKVDQKIAQATADGVYANYILAASTALLALFTFSLWMATKKMVEEASNSSESQQRAYVGIEAENASFDWDTETVQGPDGATAKITNFTPRVLVVIRNHGHTPANNISIVTCWTLMAPHGSGEPEKSFLRSEEVRGGTLMPQQTLSAKLEPLEGLISEKYWAVFPKGRTSAWLLTIDGTVGYTDSFGRSRESKFSWIIVQGDGGFRATLNKSGNEAY